MSDNDDKPMVTDPVPLLGEWPSPVFKAYEKAEYAEAFCRDGCIRLWELHYYRHIEDAARKDESEGRGHLQLPGDVPTKTVNSQTGDWGDSGPVLGHFDYQTEYMNPTYIFCVSGPNVDPTHLAGFGSHIIKIERSGAFLEALRSAVNGMVLSCGQADFVEALPVRYDKGLVRPKPDSDERIAISCAQKPPNRRRDHEYRAVVSLPGVRRDAPKCLDLRLGDPSAYAGWAPR